MKKFNKLIKQNKLKLYTLAGIFSLAVFSWYINTYILQSSASIEPLEVSMTATQDRIQIVGNDPQEFNVAFTISNHSVFGMNLILRYDSSYLQYGAEYAETGIVQPDSNIQFDVLDERVVQIDGKTKHVYLTLVSTEKSLSEDGIRLLNFKFRGIQSDTRGVEHATQKITLQSDSEFVGSDNGEPTSFSNPTKPVSVSIIIEAIPQTTRPTLQKRPIEIPTGRGDLKLDPDTQK